MKALILSPKSRDLDIRFVELKPEQLNQIRNLKLVEQGDDEAENDPPPPGVPHG